FSRDWSSDVCSSDLFPTLRHGWNWQRPGDGNMERDDEARRRRGAVQQAPDAWRRRILRGLAAGAGAGMTGGLGMGMARVAEAAAGTGACPVLRSRSEEHTSELQSRENLVCRLLLEKKKKK